LNLELSAEQRAARTEFRLFSGTEIAPHAGRWDREEAIPAGLIGELRRRGYLGSNVPREFGGIGRDMITTAC
jgi:glutaryl-CoA dehydrogenase (non-decarboxylating)